MTDLSKIRKAIVAGAGAALFAGTAGLAAGLTDGGLSTGEVGIAAGLALSAFAITGRATWAVKNDV